MNVMVLVPLSTFNKWPQLNSKLGAPYNNISRIGFYAFYDRQVTGFTLDPKGAILAVGGYSVTALTPPAALEKGTALANSHRICTGNIFNLRFLSKYNIVFVFLVTY